MSSQRENRSVLDYETEEEIRKALSSLTISKPVVTGSSMVKQEMQDWQLPVYDSSTTTLPSVEQEAERLKVLKSYCLLESAKEPQFEEFTEKVRQKFNVPWACISLVDMGRQWFKSMKGDGLEHVSETARKESFCAHTIALNDDKCLVVPNSTEDCRFENSNLVQGFPNLKFYAGAPITAEEGCKIGSLCILDKEPRGFTDDEEAELLELGKSLSQMFKERREKIQALRKRGASQANIKMNLDDESESSMAMELPAFPQLHDGAPKGKRSRANSPERQGRCSGPQLIDDSTPEKGSSFTADIPMVSERGSSTRSTSGQPMIPRPMANIILPDPKTANIDPDEYLLQLVESTWGVQLKIKKAEDLPDFFPKITETQMAAYSVQVVNLTRSNDLQGLKTYFEEKGRDGLNCFNRFGEGLLNMTCRRGMKEIVEFLLSEQVKLPVRVRDDYGRTPLHDTCWNPQPQLEITSWIMEQDPSLFLVADKRGYTPFQYARKSDWHVWRQFLFDRREHLAKLTMPEIITQFGK